MTRKSMVTHADLKRMATIANEHDVCVEVEVGETIVRVMPSGKHRVMRRELTREEKGEQALREWDLERAAKRRDKPLPDDFAL